MAQMKSCSMCRYFNEVDTDDIEIKGECRRRSPKVQTQLSIEDPMTFDAKWPMVNVLDWCGEGRFEWSVEDDD